MRIRPYVSSVLLLLLALSGVNRADAQAGRKSPGGGNSPPAASSAAASSAALNAVGALGVADIYMAYMAVGLVADAYAYGNKGYDKAAVTPIMTILASLTATAQESLQTLLDSGLLDEEDSKLASQLIGAYAAINHQAQAFLTYLSTGKTGDYETYRRKAWEVVATLYGFGG